MVAAKLLADANIRLQRSINRLLFRSDITFYQFEALYPL